MRPLLRRGETVGVIALSSPPDERAAARGLATLMSWGLRVLVAPNVWGASWRGYLAGDDDRRLEGLHMLLDSGVKLLLAARGGYGATRLLHRLPWEKLIKLSVRLVGFSDLTPVINHLASLGVWQLHGPMVAVDVWKEPGSTALRRLLFEGVFPDIRFSSAQVVVPGKAQGKVVCGNLTMLVSTLGTRYEPSWSGAILMIEEVGEPPYRVDRMLTQLAQSGRLLQVKALVAGNLPDGAEEVLVDILRRWLPDTPCVLRLPFGHLGPNLPIPVGLEAELDTEEGLLTWRV